MLFRHPVDLRGGCFPHPPFPELLHVRAAVADLLSADGERENTVRAVALQRAGADFKVLAHLRILHPFVRFPAVLLILSLLLFRLPLPGFLHVCRYPVYLLHENSKGFAFDSYYFHNLLIFNYLPQMSGYSMFFLVRFISGWQRFFPGTKKPSEGHFLTFGRLFTVRIPFFPVACQLAVTLIKRLLVYSGLSSASSIRF